MILFLVACLVFIVGAIIALYSFMEEGKESGITAAVITLIITAVLMLVSSAQIVPAGHTGVVTSFGRVEDYTLDSGLKFTAPWKKVIKMDNRVQKETVELMCFSSDIQEVSMVYTINYQIDKANAQNIYRTIGKNYYKTVIAPNIAESVKIVCAQYTAEELVAMRTQLATHAKSALAERLEEYNIELRDTSIEDVDFTDAFTNAVEEKQVATQKKLTAETEAERKIIEEKGASEIRKIKADAEAYEMLAKAEAEAAANRKVAESLTNNLIDYTYANQWDGKMPEVMAGGNEMLPVINID